MTPILLLFLLAFSNACQQRDYGNGSPVCVCNKQSCDTIAQEKVPYGKYIEYTSSKAGKRFSRQFGTIQNSSTDDSSTYQVYINRKQTYQTIYGFGGAFTDSAGINIMSLSPATRDNLMKYGLQYTMGRVPMAGTDFSTRFYTYDDVEDDFHLRNFTLQQEDYSFKIPLIKRAQELSKYNLKLVASAWTAPLWMKSKKSINGGRLNLSMYETWAEYYVKFLEAYHNHGVDIWAVTTGNEPANGFVKTFKINSMAWTPDRTGQWIGANFGPKIRLSDYNKVKILAMDDQRIFFPWIPEGIMSQPHAASYVDGFAVHYYEDDDIDPEVLSLTHYEYPNKFILNTEASTGTFSKRKVILGSWERAESYLNSIMDDLNNWVTGWIDWNLALDIKGGPNYVGNYVDSSIIVNKTADEFYKQPMFYAMGHFSKFIRPNSVRLHTTINTKDLKVVSFKRLDRTIVTNIYNPTNRTIKLTIIDGKRNIPLEIEKRSINTIMHW